MATVEELSRAFNMLLGAGLDFAPPMDEIPIRVNSWKELLSDIPGELLLQAARDIAISGERFPSVPRLRQQAKKVKWNNGVSAAPDEFRPVVDTQRPWIAATVTKDGWKKLEPRANPPKPAAELPQIEPPPHPEFKSWAEAAAWQEQQRGKQ